MRDPFESCEESWAGEKAQRAVGGGNAVAAVPRLPRFYKSHYLTIEFILAFTSKQLIDYAPSPALGVTKEFGYGWYQQERSVRTNY